MAYHDIRIYSPAGAFLKELRWKSIDVTLAEREITPLTVAVQPDYSDALFQRDSRIAYFRNGKLIGDTCWLLKQRRRLVNERGEHTIVLICFHPNVLLRSRVVAYDEGTSEADKSDIGSDTMYDYVNENFVTATDATRNLSTTHFVLDPRPGPSFGASIDIAGSYRNVLDILQDITQASAAQGSYVGFEVYVQTPPGPFHVRFYSRVRGTNRGLTSNQTFMLVPQLAGKAASVMEDWSDVASFVYAGGSGKGNERFTSTQSDATLIAQSPFGRMERFESFNTDNTAILSSNAYKVLRDYRPRREFASSLPVPSDNLALTADDLTSGAAYYDIEYTWGDIVAAKFFAPVLSSTEGVPWVTYQFDVRINPVHLQAVRSYDENGVLLGQSETTEIHLQGVEST